MELRGTVTLERVEGDVVIRMQGASANSLACGVALSMQAFGGILSGRFAGFADQRRWKMDEEVFFTGAPVEVPALLDTVRRMRPDVTPLASHGCVLGFSDPQISVGFVFPDEAAFGRWVLDGGEATGRIILLSDPAPGARSDSEAAPR